MVRSYAAALSDVRELSRLAGRFVVSGLRRDLTLTPIFVCAYCGIDLERLLSIRPVDGGAVQLLSEPFMRPSRRLALVKKRVASDEDLRHDHQRRTGH